MILCGSIAMLQAPMFDGLSFDPFSFQQDGLSPTEVSVGGCDVVQALVVSPVIVILDEGLDLGLKVVGATGSGTWWMEADDGNYYLACFDGAWKPAM